MKKREKKTKSEELKRRFSVCHMSNQFLPFTAIRLVVLNHRCIIGDHGWLVLSTMSFKLIVFFLSFFGNGIFFNIYLIVFCCAGELYRVFCEQNGKLQRIDSSSQSQV